MRTPPLSVIATWPPANYVDPVTRGNAQLIVQSIFLPLAWIVLSLRLYVRLCILRKSWWDDWIMLVAAVFTTGVTTCVILATQRYGWDLHVWDVKYPQLIAGRQISIAGQTLFLFASNGSKLSILLSYLRISTPGSKFYICTWVAIVYVVLINWIFLIVLWTQCFPAKEYWDLFDNNRHCIEEGPPLLGQITTAIAADVIVYVLPMATLARLKLPLSQRLILMAVFGAGAVVVVAGCLRLYYTYQTVYKTYDVTWVGFPLWIWTAVEVNLGIICGCIPALKPLVYKAKTHMASSNYFKTNSSSSRKSRSFGFGSKSRSRNHDIELDGDRSLVDRNFSGIEKTVDWSVEESEMTTGSFNTTAPLKHEESWLEDDHSGRQSESHDVGHHAITTADITKTSFGLAR